MKHTGRLTIILLVAASALLPSCGAPPQASQTMQSPSALPTTQPTILVPTAVSTRVPPTRQLTTSSPTTAPNPELSALTGRAYPAMDYDSRMDRIVLFSGAEKWPPAPASDTWIYDPAIGKWAKMHPSQSPAGMGTMAYDSHAAQMILYLSWTLDSKPTYLNSIAPLGETWAYDDQTNSWTNRHAAGTPFGLHGAQLVYDSESDRIILFGGAEYPKGDVHKVPMVNDTWAYDYAANAWTKMNPKVQPPTRAFQAMAYDGKADRVIIFGGMGTYLAGGPLLADTWAYDYNTDRWTELKPPIAPDARWGGRMVYDPVDQRVLLFGGEGGSGTLGDIWTYAYASNTWTNVSPKPEATQRVRHTMVFDTKAQQAVVFGGGLGWDSLDNTTWLYAPATNQWASVSANPSIR